MEIDCPNCEPGPDGVCAKHKGRLGKTKRRRIDYTSKLNDLKRKLKRARQRISAMHAGRANSSSDAAQQSSGKSDSESDSDVNDIDNPINVETLPPVSKRGQRVINESQRRLDAELVGLLKHAGTPTPLGVFVEPLVLIDAHYSALAVQQDTVPSQLSLAQDELTRGVFLYEILALQPSSPRPTTPHPAWLNDSMIDNLVRLFANEYGILAGAEFVNPSVTGHCLPKFDSRRHESLEAYVATVREALHMMSTNATAHLDLKQTTTQVVSAWSFPGHWVMFSIDSMTGTITFVDSYPDPTRALVAEQLLCGFAQLCAARCGWTVPE
jgi:hypothetical protein